MDWMAGTAVSDGDSGHQDGTERIARAGGWLGDGRETDYGKMGGKRPRKILLWENASSPIYVGWQEIFKIQCAQGGRAKNFGSNL